MANKIKAIIPDTQVRVLDKEPDLVTYRLSCTKLEKLLGFKASISLEESIEEIISQFNNEATNHVFQKVNPVSNRIIIQINKLPLIKGRYSFVLYSTINLEIADWIQEAGVFDVEEGDFYGTGKSLPDGQGNFHMDHSFQIK